MLQHLDPVPFTIDNEAHMGLSETQGLLSADDTGLMIEFRIADTITGALKSAVRHIHIPFSDVLSIRYKEKMWGMAIRILLRTRNQQALELLPDSRMGESTLIIRRRDREDAEAFCVAVQQAVVRMRTRLIEDDLNQIQEGS